MSVSFDGCAVGVTYPTTLLPIKKPWRIITSSKALVDALASKTCPRDHEHSVCQGTATEGTGYYPRQMAQL